MSRREPPQQSSGVGAFRHDLDLSGFIDKYEEHLHPKDLDNYVDTARIRDKDDLAFEPIPRSLYEDHLRARPGSGIDPELIGTGPLCASTRRDAVSASPLFAWDPNRYYRSLGIAWPYVTATRRDITRGFQTVGGEDDHWLMYCLKQLLNPEVRAAYDATPLGKEFYDDVFVQQRMRHSAANEAQKRSMEGDYTTVDEVLDERGFARLTPEEEAEIARQRALDATTSSGRDSTVGGPWLYAYYLWRTTFQDTDLLAQWQEALIREADRSIPTIAVGLMAEQEDRFIITEVDGQQIVFLNWNEAVSSELAAAAIAGLINS